MKKFILILVALAACPSFAQLHKEFDWKKTTEYIQGISTDSTNHVIAIEENYYIDYVTKFNSNIKLYKTKHNLLQINSTKGIESHNRIYIPMHNAVKIVTLKARVISPNGETTYLNKEDIKELENVEEYGNYKIFALKGVYIGSQVEVFYTIEENLTSLGSIVFQKSYPILNSTIIIDYPDNLILRSKSINGYANLKKGYSGSRKVRQKASQSNIEAMTDEESATPEANRMKLSYVISSISSEYKPWPNLIDNIRKQYLNLSAKGQKKLIKSFEAYIDKHPFDNKIVSICEFVSNNFNVVRNNNSDNLDVLKNIIDTKQASELGIVKVYVALLKAHEIPFELVLTSNRYKHKFDPDFFTLSNLQTMLIYFPEVDKYIVPEYTNSRLDNAPGNYISNKAIFIKDKGKAVFKTIRIPESSETITHVIYTIALDDLVANINAKYNLTGYKADSYRNAYSYFDKENKLDVFQTDYILSGIDDIEISKFDATNSEYYHAVNGVPFTMEMDFSADSFIEEVGNDFLFNYGKTIGKQMEFYQEAKRVNPIENHHNKRYEYRFEIKIPEGFQPKGLDDINIDKSLFIGEEEICLFKSRYEVNNNTIVIYVNENYNKLKIDLEHYDKFKDVINAAYDFSKKSILFERVE